MVAGSPTNCKHVPTSGPHLLRLIVSTPSAAYFRVQRGVLSVIQPLQSHIDPCAACGRFRLSLIFRSLPFSSVSSFSGRVLIPLHKQDQKCLRRRVYPF
jgi:hypothetical protein